MADRPEFRLMNQQIPPGCKLPTRIVYERTDSSSVSFDVALIYNSNANVATWPDSYFIESLPDFPRGHSTNDGMYGCSVYSQTTIASAGAQWDIHGQGSSSNISAGSYIIYYKQSGKQEGWRKMTPVSFDANSTVVGVGQVNTATGQTEVTIENFREFQYPPSSYSGLKIFHNGTPVVEIQGGLRPTTFTISGNTTSGFSMQAKVGSNWYDVKNVSFDIRGEEDPVPPPLPPPNVDPQPIGEGDNGSPCECGERPSPYTGACPTLDWDYNDPTRDGYYPQPTTATEKGDPYQVVLDCNISGVELSGAGTYIEGELATISWSGTIPNDMEWAGWLVDGTNWIGQQESYLTVFNSRHATATFIKKLSRLEVTVTPTGGGNTIPKPMESISHHDWGTSVNLSAAPIQGYRFVHWVDGGGNIISTSQNTSITVDKEVVKVTAVFEVITFKVYFSRGGEGIGRIFVTDKNTGQVHTVKLETDTSTDFTPKYIEFPFHTPVSITAEAANGSQFLMWQGTVNKTDMLTNALNGSYYGTTVSDKCNHQYLGPLRSDVHIHAYFIVMSDTEPFPQFSYRVNCPIIEVPENKQMQARIPNGKIIIVYAKEVGSNEHEFFLDSEYTELMPNTYKIITNGRPSVDCEVKSE